MLQGLRDEQRQNKLTKDQAQLIYHPEVARTAVLDKVWPGRDRLAINRRWPIIRVHRTAIKVCHNPETTDAESSRKCEPEYLGRCP